MPGLLAVGGAVQLVGLKRRRRGMLAQTDCGEEQVLPELVCLRHGLYPGMPISAETWRQVCAEAREELCAEGALRLLGQRPHGACELRNKLRSRKHDADAVNRVIDRLLQNGLLNDAAFAEIFAEEKLRLAGWGRRRIEAALRKKGVAGNVVREVMTELFPDTGDVEDSPEYASALTVAERKLRALQREPDPWARRRKLTAFLARRGFGGDVCRRVVERLL